MVRVVVGRAVPDDRRLAPEVALHHVEKADDAAAAVVAVADGAGSDQHVVVAVAALRRRADRLALPEGDDATGNRRDRDVVAAQRRTAA